MTYLTPHFSLEELSHSDTALRLGIDNTPPPDVVPRLTVLALGLEVCRTALGDLPIAVSSGYRCEALERILCAKDFAAWCARHGRDVATAWPEYFARKAHPRGYAGDWTCRRAGSPAQVVTRLRDMGVRADQIIEEGTWVHTSFDPRMRGQVLTARFAPDGTPTYAPAT